MVSDRRTLTVAEAARELGVSRNTAYDAVRRGEIPSIRIGRRILVPRRRLEDLLESGTDDAAPFETPAVHSGLVRERTSPGRD